MAAAKAEYDLLIMAGLSGQAQTFSTWLLE